MEYKIISHFKDEEELKNYLESLEKLDPKQKEKSLEDIVKFGYVERNVNNNKKRSS